MSSTFLQPEDARQLADYLRHELEQPVEIWAFGQTQPHPDDQISVQAKLSEDLWAVMAEVAALSPLLSLRRVDVYAEPDLAARWRIHQVPAIGLEAQHSTGKHCFGLRYFGLPSNYEFGSFLEALVNVSTGRPELRPETLEALQDEALAHTDVLLQVYYTQTCALCPLMTHLVQQFAVAHPRIRAEIIDAQEFPRLAQAHGVRGVPHVVVNGNRHLVGLRHEADLLRAIRLAARKPCPVHPATDPPA